MNKIAYACDVGSTIAGNFGWARIDLCSETPPSGSDNIEELLEEISADMSSGVSVALGMEAPLYMPVPLLSSQLSSGREGEGNRSMFAPAGACVTTLACHQSAFLLQRLALVRSGHTLTLDASVWQEEDKVLLLWEAFVSGSAHDTEGSNIRDAATAATFFREHQDSLKEHNAVSCGLPLSLIGAVALWSRWTNDVEILHQPCVVLRPPERYAGEISPV